MTYIELKSIRKTLTKNSLENALSIVLLNDIDKIEIGNTKSQEIHRYLFYGLLISLEK
jgi:fido (protein-threonine AMPylation protein)